MLTIERQNDYVLTWENVDLATDRTWVNDNISATMVLKLTSDDSTISGTSVSMTYVSSSNGSYQGRIPASALPSSLTLGALYYIEVSATSGSFTGYAKLESQVVVRTQ